MPDTLETAFATARRWWQANPDPGPGGLVLVLDGQFVGFAATLPSPADWAPGCLAVAADGRVQLVRPAGFRGEVEWIELGVFALGGDEEASPPSPEPYAAPQDPADDYPGSPVVGGGPAIGGDEGIPPSLAGPEAGLATAEDAPDSP